MKIQGYFLYHISSDHTSKYWFVRPCKIYSTLQGAKQSSYLGNSLYDLPNAAFIIVPIKQAFDRKSPVKYMFINGSWSTDLKEDIVNAFYKWRYR